MSLVVAFAGKTRAVMGGDRRSISFFGAAPKLEEELYGGKIRTDADLARRAKELGARMAVSDRREKVWRTGDVLVGEVTELSAENQRRRRVYATPGGYMLVDVTGNEAVVTRKGASTLIILGNRFTQKLAYDMLGTGKVPDVSSVKAVFQEASEKTASVSREHSILSVEGAGAKPDPYALLAQAMLRDSEERGWIVSGLQ